MTSTEAHEELRNEGQISLVVRSTSTRMDKWQIYVEDYYYSSSPASL